MYTEIICSCEEYAQKGCIVYATARNLETMDFKHQGIRKLKLDVVNGEEVLRIVKAVIDDKDKIDILVNNAGTNCAGKYSIVQTMHNLM